MTILDDRRQTKERHERYRMAAARLYPTASLRNLVSVNETAERDGAFIELTVWVPAAEIAPVECADTCEEHDDCDRVCAREASHEGRHACKNHV